MSVPSSSSRRASLWRMLPRARATRGRCTFASTGAGAARPARVAPVPSVASAAALASGAAPRWAASAASACWTGWTASAQRSLPRLQTAGPPLRPRPQRTPRCPLRAATSSGAATVAASGRRARRAWRRARRRLAPGPPQLPGRRRQQRRRARLALPHRVPLPRARPPLGPWLAARHRRAPRRCQL